MNIFLKKPNQKNLIKKPNQKNLIKNSFQKILIVGEANKRMSRKEFRTGIKANISPYEKLIVSIIKSLLY
jgi:hypothetical protein